METWAWPVVLVGRWEGPVSVVVGVQLGPAGRQVAQGLPALQELLQRAWEQLPVAVVAVQEAFVVVDAVEGVWLVVVGAWLVSVEVA